MKIIQAQFADEHCHPDAWSSAPHTLNSSIHFARMTASFRSKGERIVFGGKPADQVIPFVVAQFVTVYSNRL